MARLPQHGNTSVVVSVMRRCLIIGLVLLASCTPAQWAAHNCNTGYTPFAGTDNCVALEIERDDMLGRADMEKGLMITGWQGNQEIRVMP